MYFCTGHMRQPFFSRAIPTYGVLPYSMIHAGAEMNSYYLGKVAALNILVLKKLKQKAI